MDVTSLVHSHHLNRERVLAVLAKHFVRDTKTRLAQSKQKGRSSKGKEEGEEFSWAEDGFIRTLQRRVRAALGDDRRPTAEMRALVWLTLLAWAASFLAMCLVRTHARLAALAAGFFLYGLLGIGHNGMHTVRKADRGGLGMDVGPRF